MQNPQNTRQIMPIPQLPLLNALNEKIPLARAHARLRFLDAKNLIIPTSMINYILKFTKIKYKNGGPGGSRTRVRNSFKVKSFTGLSNLLSQIRKGS